VPGLVEATKVLEKLIADPESEPFRSPVEWEAWGLLDYPKIVKEPMDLGTVKKNVESDNYNDLKEFNRHVQLVWKNCMAYNADKSDYFKIASRFEKRYEKEISRIMKKHGLMPATSTGRSSTGGTVLTRAPTSDEKASLCRAIYDLNEIQLGQLIEQIDAECESVLDKTSKSEVIIDVDAITMANFTKLDSFLKELSSKDKTKKNPPADAGVAKVEPEADTSDPESKKRPAEDAIEKSDDDVKKGKVE